MRDASKKRLQGKKMYRSFSLQKIRFCCTSTTSLLISLDHMDQMSLPRQILQADRNFAKNFYFLTDSDSQSILSFFSCLCFCFYFFLWHEQYINLWVPSQCIAHTRAFLFSLKLAGVCVCVCLSEPLSSLKVSPVWFQEPLNSDCKSELLLQVLNR